MEEGADGLTPRHRVAFLTTAELDGFVTYDHDVVAPAADVGIEVVFVPWRQAEDWSRFDAVVVRSPWDYQHDLPRFLATLDDIEAAGVPLWNSAAVARWNCEKGYLGELLRRGLPVVPTEFVRLRDADHLHEVAKAAVAAAAREGITDTGDEPRVVVKPRVGASGQESWALTLGADPGEWSAAAATLTGREVLVQPFLPTVLHQGELSLIVIDGEPSHTIRKVPRAGEYRSQEEWGGHIETVDVPDFERWAMEFVAGVDEARALLYLRVDGLQDAAGAWRLGELELVEPSLYFPFGPGSARRFAEALSRRLG